MNRYSIAGTLLICSAALSSARADEVFLTGGGRLSGEVVERRAGAVVIDVGPGRVTLPLSRVERIVGGTSALAVYRDRAARLASGDVRGWVDLGRWAQEHDLHTLAREAFEHVLAIDPGNEPAHRALGHVQLGGRWMTEEESYRARGLVEFEGRWMTPQQAQAMAADRAAEEQARRAAREAEARAREAEARAAAAEADARRAAAEAEASATGGIPYPWAFAPPIGYGGVVSPYGVSPYDPITGAVQPVPLAPPPQVIIKVGSRREPACERAPERTRATPTGSARAHRRDVH